MITSTFKPYKQIEEKGTNVENIKIKLVNSIKIKKIHNNNKKIKKLQIFKHRNKKICQVIPHQKR